MTPFQPAKPTNLPSFSRRGRSMGNISNRLQKKLSNCLPGDLWCLLFLEGHGSQQGPRRTTGESLRGTLCSNWFHSTKFCFRNCFEDITSVWAGESKPTSYAVKRQGFRSSANGTIGPLTPQKLIGSYRSSSDSWGPDSRKVGSTYRWSGRALLANGTWQPRMALRDTEKCL